MKQYNYKPRSNSTSSQGSGSAAAPGSPTKDTNTKNSSSAIADGTGSGSPMAQAVAGRRRVCLVLFPMISFSCILVPPTSFGKSHIFHIEQNADVISLLQARNSPVSVHTSVVLLIRKPPRATTSMLVDRAFWAGCGILSQRDRKCGVEEWADVS